MHTVYLSREPSESDDAEEAVVPHISLDFSQSKMRVYMGSTAGYSYQFHCGAQAFIVHLHAE